MKKEMCPFCGHRWICKSRENPIRCPNCEQEFYEPQRMIDQKVEREY
jgi:tRNA(Ile2) C34 agmatinyltransferase TiaS